MSVEGENLLGIKTRKGVVAKEQENAGVALLSSKSARDAEAKKCPEVEAFLQSISMLKYLPMFIENGFEDLETILELRDEDFSVMRVPLGHKLRMLKRIKELKPVEAKPITGPVQKLKGIQKNSAAKSELSEEPKQSKKSVRFGETLIIGGNEKEAESESMPPQCEEVKEKAAASSKVAKPEKTNARIRTIYRMDAEQSVAPVMDNEVREACWNCYKLFTKGKGFTDPLNHNVVCIYKE